MAQEPWTPAYRRLFEPDHELAGDPACRRWAWLDLCDMAAFRDRTQVIGGRVVTLRRGEFLASIRFLAKRWRWSKDKVRRFLAMLARDGCAKIATVNGTPDGTVYRIVSYDTYRRDRDTSRDTERDTNGTPTGQREEGKKEKKEDTSPNGLAPIDDVENSPDDAEPTFADLMGMVRSELYYRDGKASDRVIQGRPWSDRRDASVLRALLDAGVPSTRIEAALRGFSLRRKAGEFQRMADKPTMLLFWSRKEGVAQFFAECERAWGARPPDKSIGSILQTLTRSANGTHEAD